MKYLKLFENFESFEEVEDYLIDLIDTGLIARLEDGKFFEKSLVKRSPNRRGGPTHYSIKFRIVPKVISSFEDLELNKNLYEKLQVILSRIEQGFEIKDNNLSIFIPVSESIKNFFDQWIVGNSTIKVKSTKPSNPQDYINSPSFLVYEIDDDFSVNFYRWFMKNKTTDEVIEQINSQIQAGTGYTAEVSGVSTGSIGHSIYIKVQA